MSDAYEQAVSPIDIFTLQDTIQTRMTQSRTIFIWKSETLKRNQIVEDETSKGFTFSNNRSEMRSERRTETRNQPEWKASLGF